LQLTHFDDLGIYVSYPGLRIHCADADTWLHFKTGFRNPQDGKWYKVKDQGPFFESKLPETQRWAYWSKKLHELRDPALVLELPSDYAAYTVGVLVDIHDPDRHSDGSSGNEHTSIICAKYLCRIWIDDCEQDRMFQHSTCKSVESWIKDQYYKNVREELEVRQGATQSDLATVMDRYVFPPQLEIAQSIRMDQRWCIG
jgi:hypothetical protein